MMTMPFALPILDQHPEMYTEARLKPLDGYRYQGVDRSPISRFILSYYWNWAVTLVPLWMAYVLPLRLPSSPSPSL